MNQSVNQGESEKIEGLAQVFKGLADKTRLHMLLLLLEHGELCVCDFVGVLRITQSKASRHLRYLYHSGLVEDRREGQWTHYRLAAAMDPRTRLVVEALANGLGEDDRAQLKQELAEWLERKGETLPPGP